MNFGARLYAELRGDRVIWMILAVLSIFSILAVYSSTGTIAYKLSGGNTTSYLIKHVLILGFGLFLAYLAYLTPYMRFMRMAPWLWLLAFGLLVYTLGFGKEINQARRWIEIPFIGLTFQTSDFAKMALILLVAREISRHKDYIKDFSKAFVPIILPIILITGLIAPADLSTAIVLFATCFTMMFIGRVDFRFMGLLVLLAVVMFAFLIVVHKFVPDIVRVDTWTSRLQDWLGNPEGTFQNQQAKIAIANGGIFGSGPGNSIQRNYLPTPYADFIYAVFCEEYGLVGSFILLGLYVMLFFRTVRLVTISEKSFGAMLAVGLSLNIVIQALTNMAISVQLVPVGGLTLPMVSWGGTSVLFSCLFFGIILSVSRYIEAAAAQQALAVEAVPVAPQQQMPQGGGQQGGGQQQPQRRDGGGQQGGGQRKDSGGGGGNRQGGGGGQQGGGGHKKGGGNR
ncbi:MAG: FtsW/RodA/SpoVE family cell cycle protein [Bacteroidetes bacterium]|nr:FtsW/RodA/SpoVE family cell cycle protein [Bacteroidota bacterium]